MVLSAFLFARQRQKFKCSLCIAIISLVETTNRPSPDCISHVGLWGLGHPRSQGQSDSTAVCRQVAAGSCQDDMAKNGALCSACFCKRLKFFIWTYIGFMTVWSYTHAHTHTHARSFGRVRSLHRSIYLFYPIYPIPSFLSILSIPSILSFLSILSILSIQSNYLSVFLIYLSVCLPTYLSILPSICLLVYRSTDLLSNLSIRLTIYLATYVSIYLPTYLSIDLSVCLPIVQTIYLSILLVSLLFYFVLLYSF